ncbi:MAG: class I SAM-dependent RNA methyltransferase [Pseudomonadota bacterium]
MTPLTISRLGHLGDGLTADGVAVPFTLPGDVVDAAPPHRRHRDSPHRRHPPCPHFGACGGCALQQADDPFLEGWKEAVIARALAARGLQAPFLPAFTAPERSRRRATLTARRTRKTVEIGFHARRSDRLVPIKSCGVLHPNLMAALPGLEALVRIGGSRKGLLRLALWHSDDGLDVAVSGGKALDLPLRQALATLAGAQAFARLSWEGEVIALHRPPRAEMGRTRVVPPPGAFLQAVAAAETVMASDAAEHLAGADPVADLFAGCGPFALRLAERSAVHAVEGEDAMLAALDVAWRGVPGLRTVTTEVRDLFRRPLLPADLSRFAGVVLDPPRAGAAAQAAALAQSAVPRIVAVSCAPVSFARDAAILVAGGYRLTAIRLIDQFRWSPHVELVARFRR